MTFSEELKARKSFLIILQISRAWETASELSVTEKNHHCREPSKEYRQPPQRKRLLHGLSHEKSPSPADHPWAAATSLLSLFSSGFLFKTTLPNFLFLSTILLPSFISWTCQWLFFFKVFIEFVTIFLPLYVSWTFGHMAGRTVVSWPGREPASLPWKAESESLNHQGSALVNGFYYSLFVSNCNSSSIPK